MRKNSSRALKKPKVSVEKVRGRPSSSAPTRATIGSLMPPSGSARRTTPGKNTPEPPPARNDQRLNRLLQQALDLKNEGKFDDAADAFRAIVGLYPECAPANGLLGAILHG